MGTLYFQLRSLYHASMYGKKVKMCILMAKCSVMIHKNVSDILFG